MDRCLASEPGAWDLLYRQFHDRLLKSIGAMLGARADANLVDEIAACVWYAVVDNDGELLSRFEPARGCRLSTYLSAIAKAQAGAVFRAEKRRRNRESLASRPEGEENEQSYSRLEEFSKTLTRGERDFFVRVLLEASRKESSPASGHSPASVWQLRSRIKTKLQQFLR